MPVTLRAVLDRFVEHRDLSRGSHHQYRATVASFERWLGRHAGLDDLNDQTVNRWLMDLQDTLAPATRRARRNALLALWRSGVRGGVIHVEPGEIRGVRVPLKPVRTLAVDDVRKLVEAAEHRGGYYPAMGLRKAVVQSLWLRVGWDTAARQPDLAAFAPCDLSEDGILPFTQSKTGRIHVAWLHASTMRALQQSDHAARDRLLPWAYSAEFFRQEFSDLFRWCGIPGSFKLLRSASGTNVERHYPGAGMAHLGHGRSVARDHYFDARIIAQGRPRPEEL